MKHAAPVTVGALRRIPLWAGLDESVLADVAPAMRVLSAPKGSVVVTQDEPTRGVFFVTEGLLSFSRRAEDGGEPLVFAVAHVGQVFGERSVVDDSSYSATVTAMRDSILLHLPREDALRVFLSVPAVARRLMQHLSALLGDMNTARNSLTQHRAAPRLMDALVRIAMPVTGQPGTVFIEALPTQESLARLSGLKRETVSRLLAQWDREQRITRAGRTLLLKIPDQAEL